MNFYIAVVFFCAGECAFFKSSENYYKLSDCKQKVQAVMKDLENKGIESEGTCLPIKVSST